MKIKVISTEFYSEGETLRGNFVVPQGAGPFPGICKFHGFPGSSDQVSGIATRLAEAGFAVLTFDFRGFRSSDGIFSLAGEVQDAYPAVTHLLDADFTRSDWVGVYGASYGSAVAVLGAIRDSRISVVCLRAPVYDTLEFAKSPLISQGVKELLQSTPHEMHGLTDPMVREEIADRMIQDAKTLNPIKEIHKIAPRPIFIITGDADKGIALKGVGRLFKAAKEPKEMVVIHGADHNLTNPAAYELTVNAIVAWFKNQVHTEF